LNNMDRWAEIIERRQLGNFEISVPGFLKSAREDIEWLSGELVRQISLAGKVDELLKQTAHLSDEIEDLGDTIIVDLKGEVARLKQENDLLKEKLAQAAKIESLEDQIIDDWTADLARLEADNDALRCELDTRNYACGKALDTLWYDIVICSKGDNFGDWEYPGDAVCWIKAVHAEEVAQAANLDRLRKEHAAELSDIRERAK